MEYEQLSTEYQDDHIAEAMLGREMEFFHYDVDLKNYQEMLAALPEKETAKRGELAQRIKDITAQMDIVERVYSALKNRIRDPQAHAAAIGRVRAKRLPATG